MNYSQGCCSVVVSSDGGEDFNNLNLFLPTGGQSILWP